MSETLYPHEVVVRALKEPISFGEFLVWYIYGLSSLIILYFVSIAFGYMIDANNIITPMKFQDFIIFGLNFDCVLCVLLMTFGLAGIVVPNKRSLK